MDEKQWEDDAVCNQSANESLNDILDRAVSRRGFLGGGLGATALAFLGGSVALLRPGTARAFGPPFGFDGVPISTSDTLIVPAGYSASILWSWGDPVSRGPKFRFDASNSAEEQAQQAGMHNDGIHFFPLPFGSDGSDHGLLVMNHEYTDDGLLHKGGKLPWTAEKVAKSQEAHGVSVIEVRLRSKRWEIVRPSAFARRISARSFIAISGPAAGSPLLATPNEPNGLAVQGTVNNCAMGYTPWGTYLACEENFDGYFVRTSGAATAIEARYGIATGFDNDWHLFDPRFDPAVVPNEAHKFGWVVEIDPFDPTSIPVKRTSLGRIKHEGAYVVTTPDNHVVVYMGDDQRFEYIYKWVSNGLFDPANREANFGLLDDGTLYVAKFDEDGTGEWLPLTPANPALAGLGIDEILVNTRGAGDLVGATKMDRPEWISCHPVTGEVYCTLTNNTRRGSGSNPGVGAANPRPINDYGHIIRWREAGGDATALSFEWDIFILAGDYSRAGYSGDVRGDKFGSPDGLWFDAAGVLWIQTDVSATSQRVPGPYEFMGNNQMLAADPTTGETRRFLTGPLNCEITGITGTPDLRTIFVNVQHPGEPPDDEPTLPGEEQKISNWPDFKRPGQGRPRSSTVVIRRADGGIIGS